MFDNSAYPENSPYYCNVNKKIIGKFKDKASGVPITESIGLKSKMFSNVKDNEKGGRTAKRIKKNIIKNNIRHEDYKNTLINNEQMHHKMKTIRSQRHQLGSYEITKYHSAVSMTSATSTSFERANRAINMHSRGPTKQLKGEMRWYPHVLYYYSEE